MEADGIRRSEKSHKQDGIQYRIHRLQKQVALLISAMFVVSSGFLFFILFYGTIEA
jgi:hypothetical protein